MSTSNDATLTPRDRSQETARTLSSPEPDRSTSGAGADVRFVPGDVVDARYRVIDRIGEGGMGEVYAAEDLKLSERVALKFLPERLLGDGGALSRLHDEVRLARQVSHRNVVRVHDLGEADGQPFLSMEHVEGEDLASLLRRIGALPEPKALDLAQQVCRGVGAAHREGLLHRDLKPANVLVDGRGDAKVTDFGLATLEREMSGRDRAGTPLYMAPEQLVEGRASAASDVYALGLLLYEMFVGRRLFDDVALPRRQRPDLDAIAAELDSFDPQVAITVTACLRPEPAERPGNALEVAALLPGGDPLLEAVVAGETPSPEMVARAPVEGAVAPGWAVAGFAVTSLLVLTSTWLMGARSIYSIDGLPLRPEVLEHLADELLDDVGAAPASHQFGGFRMSSWIPLTELEGGPDVWGERKDRWPSLVEYQYLRSTKPLWPRGWFRWTPSWEDPAAGRGGVAGVRLDSRGRLLELRRSPDSLAVEPAGSPASTKGLLDALLVAAGVDLASLAEASPRSVPDLYVDERLAFTARRSEEPDDEVLVEAALRDGAVLRWSVTPLEGRGLAPELPTARPALLIFLFMLVFCGGLAWHNVRQGRGDSRGATRVALAMAVLVFGDNVLRRGGLTPLREFVPLVGLLASASLLAGALRLFYLALEPALRRRIPWVMVSWSRLLAGRWRDPLVGGHLLIGLAAAAGYHLAIEIFGPFAGWITRPIAFYPHGLGAIEGPVTALGASMSWTVLGVPFLLIFLATLPAMLMPRGRWPLASRLLGGALLATFGAIWQGGGVPGLLLGALVAWLALGVGLVAVVGWALYQTNLVLVPVGLESSLWWASTSWLAVAAVVVLAGLSALAASGYLARRPQFRTSSWRSEAGFAPGGR